MITKNRKSLHVLYGASFFFALHLALTAYVNSTFLSSYIEGSIVGLLYTVASLISLLGLWVLPEVLPAIGNRAATLFLVTINATSLFGMAYSHDALALSVLFIMFFASNTLIAFSLDLFIEHFTEAKATGQTRGFYLSFTNLAWIGAPLLSGVVISLFGYSSIYMLAGGLMVLILLYVHLLMKKYTDAPYKKRSFAETIHFLKTHKGLRRITSANFLLQFFFSWMIIYTPLYLNGTIGFTWTEIGLIFLVMLLPFSLLQFPLGYFADKKYGERGILAIGFAVMALATASVSFIHSKSILTWMIVLFFTRVGAATVEVMSETYFFKKVRDDNPALIGIFRDTIPLGYIIGPAIATGILLVIPLSSLFLTLGIIMLFGIFVALSLSKS